MRRLDGKVAVITGATSGIGLRTAEVFIAEGANTVIAGRRAAEGEALAQRLGDRCIFLRTDVTDEEQMRALIGLAVAKFGRLDCLFNNAGAPAQTGGIEGIEVALKSHWPRRCTVPKAPVALSSRLLVPLTLGAWLIAAAAPAEAQFKSWVAARFPDTPEGLAADSKGNLYATLMHIGEIVRVKDDGSYDHIAWVPSREESGQGDLLGLDFDKDDNIYVAYTAHAKRDLRRDLVDPFHPACRDATITRSGVYKIDGKSKKVTALATKAQGWPFCYPDDVAIDSSGNVYLTDLTYSGIWKISSDGEKVDLWSADALLNWPPKPYSGLPLGVNDLVIDKQGKNIYAVTDGNPLLLRIPIKDDGTAGDPVALPSGFSAFDGIELDAKGNIYVSEILLNQIWVLSPDGKRVAMTVLTMFYLSPDAADCGPICAGVPSRAESVASH